MSLQRQNSEQLELKHDVQLQTMPSDVNKIKKKHKKIVRNQEQALDEYAKKEGIWFDNYGIFEYEYGAFDEGLESHVSFKKQNSDKLYFYPKKDQKKSLPNGKAFLNHMLKKSV